MTTVLRFSFLNYLYAVALGAHIYFEKKIMINDIVIRILEMRKTDLVNKDGATQSTIQNLSDSLNLDLEFPKDLSILLSIRNGDPYSGIPGLKGCRYILSCDDIKKDYITLVNDAKLLSGLDMDRTIIADRGVKPFLWSERWIPFLVDNDLYFALDLNPDSGGIIGQIIHPVWENDRVYRVADSLEKFFEDFYNAFCHDMNWPYEYDPTKDIIFNKT